MAYFFHDSTPIITINYNNVDGLRKTINSVISQTFRDFEWIVIDGGSTDGSKDLINQYVEYFSYSISEPDSGVYNAMNKGIKVAHGEYFIFLNSGDYFYDKNVLEKADLILKDPDKYILERYIDNPPIDFEFAFKNDVQDKQWWLIHDVLTDNDYIHYLDWKDDAGIFLTEFDALKGRDKISAVVAEKDLDGKDELTEIFTYVNSMIEQDNYVLCVYDIDADGYPIFLTKKENLPLLTESAEKVGHRIGRAG